MASTYTVNLGIEKIGTGEQSGTWGTTTNTNFDLIDQAINGAVAVTLASAGTSGSPNTLAITNGATSDGRNKFIDFNDGGDLGATAYVQLDPNDAEKLVHIRNSLSGGRSLILFQGTYNASNDFEVPNGKDVVLKFDGGGATATVTQVFEDLLVTAVAATTVDTTNIEVTNLKAKDGTSAGSIADSTGVVTIASSVLTTTDINGGSVDGVTLGTNSAVTEAQIDNININGNTISSTDTNGNVTITPDGTGSVAITKIDVAGGEIDGTAIGGNSASTATFTDLTASGTVSFSGATVSNGGTVTTVDINGGTLDGVTIGGSSAGAITGTTGQFNTSLNVDGTVTADGMTVDGTAIIDSSSNTPVLRFDESGSAKFFIGESSAVGGGAGYDLYAGAGDGISLFTNASERMRIDSAGNVGIGVSSITNSAGYVRVALGDVTGTILENQVNGTATSRILTTASKTSLETLTATPLVFETNGAERARIDSTGSWLVGGTNSRPAEFLHPDGFSVRGDTVGQIQNTVTSAHCGIFNRDGTDGEIFQFRKEGAAVGSIGTVSGLLGIGSGDAILAFDGTGNAMYPMSSQVGGASDGVLDFGSSLRRFKDLYRSGSTISTSDRNMKQDERPLTDAEAAVAQACKGLLKAFRFIDAVETDGNGARIHFGIIAQDLPAAFEAEGLDANNYAMFRPSTFTDDEGNEQTRLGVCYENLLAFIIAAL